MPDTPVAPAPIPAPLVAPTHPILVHLWDGTKAVTRVIRNVAVFAYEGIVDHLGPAIGTEFGKLHLADLYRSLLTSAGFTSTGAVVAFAVSYFIPTLTALTAHLNPFASALLVLVLDLMRRLGQESPTPTPTPAPTPPVATEFPTLTP